jgi:hypothetical protein
VRCWAEEGYHIFVGTTYQNGENIPNDQKYTNWTENLPKWPQNIPYKIYPTKYTLQNIPYKIYPTKFTQIWIFGLKINHLKTLGQSEKCLTDYVILYR